MTRQLLVSPHDAIDDLTRREPYTGHVNIYIAKLEYVQRRFTKRLVGLHTMTYADRIDLFKLDSLERGDYVLISYLITKSCPDL